MISNQKDFKNVPLPDRVTISVKELYSLRENAAMLAALKSANVKDWQGYNYAKWLFEHDPDIQDIKLGNRT